MNHIFLLQQNVLTHHPEAAPSKICVYADLELMSPRTPPKNFEALSVIFSISLLFNSFLDFVQSLMAKNTNDDCLNI